MFGRKKKEPKTEEQPKKGAVTAEESDAQSAAEPETAAAEPEARISAPVVADAKGAAETNGAAAKTSGRGNRVQKVGIVSSDKMQKTVVVRVDRQVLHQKYRRYVRRTTKFKAHYELGAGVGDRVRVVETRPLSAQKRWRVVEILQKAAK